MRSRLMSYGFIERLKLSRALSSVTVKFDDLQANHDSMREAVKALELKVKEEPREWIFWHALGDWYSSLGDYANAVRACEKCYELRPQDPRSAYSLATTLRVLTRAHYSDHPRLKEMEELVARTGRGYDEFNPFKSQQGLEELGLTVDLAAHRAADRFEEVLRLGIGEEEAAGVRENLAAMRTEFPELKINTQCRLPQQYGMPVDKIKGQMDNMLGHVNSAVALSTSVFDTAVQDLSQTRAAFSKVRKSVDSAYACLENMERGWPSGEPVLEELKLFLDLMSKWLDNRERWNDALVALELPDPGEIARMKQFAIKGNHLASQIDEHYARAASLLGDLTGLHLPELFPHVTRRLRNH
jgi:tetratricopeptide (TPR) repeat protein